MRRLRTHSVSAFVPPAPLEVRDDEAGGERVARRSAVDRFYLRRLCPRDLLAVLEQDGALRSKRERDELPREFTSCS